MKKFVLLAISFIALVLINLNCGPKAEPTAPVATATVILNTITPTSSFTPTTTNTEIAEETQTITVTYEESYTPQITATNTPSGSVTPDYSPWISGKVFLPPNITPTEVLNKTLKVYYDTDLDRSNGTVYCYNQPITSDLVNYFINNGILHGTVFSPGTYYVYAYIDMNNNYNIDNFDLYGQYPSEITVPPNRWDINFNLNYLPVKVTVTVNLPENSFGKRFFCGFLADNYYTYNSFANFLQANIQTFSDMGLDNNGKKYQFVLNFNKKYPVNLMAYVDYNDNLDSTYYLPDKGDFIKFYNTNSTSMPTTKLFSTTNDMEVVLDLGTISENTSGIVNLPAGVNNKNYVVVASTSALFPEPSSNIRLFIDQGTVSGNNFSYNLFIFLPMNYYITAIVDNDNSGFESLPTQGDYFGIYNKPTIDNWYSPYNFDQNANLPGNNFNINCTAVPFNLGTPTFTPTKTFTNTPTFTATNTQTPTNTPTKIVVGTISGCLINKYLDIYVDDDLNPFNGAIRYSLDNYPQSNIFNYTVPYNVPTGEYYIYAIQRNTNRTILQPLKMGYYGSNYPDEPQNKIVITETSYITTANITLQEIPGQINGTITLPQVNSGKNFAIILDDDLNIENGFFNYYKNITDTNTNYNYQMKVIFSGSYYIYAFVDAASPFDCFSKDGAPEKNPGTGDYYGEINIDAYQKTQTYNDKNIVLQIKN